MPSCCGARTWPRCTRSCGRGWPTAGWDIPHVRCAVLSTFTHRSMDLADIPIVFKPGTDLAILNYIANHIIQTGRVNEAFVRDHTIFMSGATDIGYGLRPDNPVEMAAKGAADPGKMEPIDFEAFKALVSEYTLEKAVGAVRRRARIPRGTGGTLRRPRRSR